MMVRIIAISFIAFAIAAVIFMIFGVRNKIKGYYVATSLVYLSGTCLIGFLSAKLVGIPVSFIVLSEICIFSVFAITVFTIYRFGKGMDKIKEDIKAGKIRKNEDFEEDSEDDWKNS